MANGYDHRQGSPLGVLFLLLGGGLTAAALRPAPNPEWLPVILFSAGGIFVISALCFWFLRIRIDREELRISFGPLPIFRKTHPLAEIAHVEAGRTTLLEGWGIHYVPGRGWTWNLWGFDCVVLTFTSPEGRPKTLRLGTNEPEKLCRAIESAIAKN